MTRTVTIHADAEAEFEAAALWYDDQRDGLGQQFLAAVDRAIQHARTWPHTGAPIEGLPSDLDVRRLPASRFPYHVAYMASTSSPSPTTTDGPAIGSTAPDPLRRNNALRPYAARIEVVTGCSGA